MDLDIIKILNEFIKQASQMNLKEINIITLYQVIDKFDENKDGYLSDKEFLNIMSHLNINNKSITDRILSRLFDKNNSNMISITNFVLLIDYFYRIYKNKVILNLGQEKYFSNFLPNINQAINKEVKLLAIKKKKVYKYLEKYPNVNSISSKTANILTCLKEYEKITHKGFYSGAIIISKYLENNDIYFKMTNIQRKIIDYITLFNKFSNYKITENFQKRICTIDSIRSKYEESADSSNRKKQLVQGEDKNYKFNNDADISVADSKLSKRISDMLIPEVKIFVFDEKEMIDIKNINRSN